MGGLTTQFMLSLPPPGIRIKPSLWVAYLEAKGVDFESFAAVLRKYTSLDAKVRTAISKSLGGKDAEHVKDLVSHIHQKRDELRKAAMPRQITGLQMLYLVRSFYRVHDTEKNRR